MTLTCPLCSLCFVYIYIYIILLTCTEPFCGQKAEQEQQAKEEIERQMEEERLEAVKLDREREESRLREEFELKDHLRQQMMELKNREAEVRLTTNNLYSVTLFGAL